MSDERLIDKIVAMAVTERRKLHVPEWGVDIYFEPLTKAQLEAAIPKNGARTLQTQSMLLLVHTAKDAEGKRLFRMEDVELLRQKADLNVLTRVEGFMWGTLTPTVEEAEQELKDSPPSAS